jgi:integrase
MSSQRPLRRMRLLSEEELRRLLVACSESLDPMLNPVVILFLSTGMRAREALSMTWNRIDLDRGCVVLVETNSRDRRIVPIKRRSVEVLREHAARRNRGTDLVFPGSRNRYHPYSVGRAWVKALKVADIAHFTFYNLHYCAAAYVASNGASLTEIAEILGHNGFGPWELPDESFIDEDGHTLREYNEDTREWKMVVVDRGERITVDMRYDYFLR